MGAEYWRTLKPQCQGIIFWQLNDDWPTVSWSSIEYSGKWKQLQMQAKRFYAPVMATIIQEKEKGPMRLCVVSDLAFAVKAQVEVQVIDVSGNKLASKTFQASLKNSAKEFSPSEMEKLQPKDRPANEYFFYVSTRAQGEDGVVYSHWNAFFPVELKELKMQKTEIALTVRNNKNGTFSVTMKTAFPAFFATLDAVGIKGRFSDNSIVLLPGETTVEFVPEKKTTTAALKKALVVMSLRDTYK